MDMMEVDETLGDPQEAGSKVTNRDDDSARKSPGRNPVEEHLLKQLAEVEERVSGTKSEIEETRIVKEKVLRRFSSRAFYGESATSDSDNDLYTAMGEPNVNRKRSRKRAKSQPLKLTDIWQRLSDDKWVIGVVLRNTTNRKLYDLDLFVIVKDQQELRGISTFWTIDGEDRLWRKVNSVNRNEEVVATVVLNIPLFHRSSSVELSGAVCYELGENQLQTIVPKVQLNVQDTIDNSYELKFLKDTTEMACDVLTVKAMCIEETFVIEDGFKPIDIGFLEIDSRVYLAKDCSLKHCILELQPSSSTEGNVTVYTRSTAQLNIIMHLLRDDLPKKTNTTSCKNMLFDEALQLLEQELELYLNAGSVSELQKIRVKSDLLFEELKQSSNRFVPFK